MPPPIGDFDAAPFGWAVVEFDEHGARVRFSIAVVVRCFRQASGTWHAALADRTAARRRISEHLDKEYEICFGEREEDDLLDIAVEIVDEACAENPAIVEQACAYARYRRGATLTDQDRAALLVYAPIEVKLAVILTAPSGEGGREGPTREGVASDLCAHLGPRRSIDYSGSAGA